MMMNLLDDSGVEEVVWKYLVDGWQDDTVHVVALQYGACKGLWKVTVTGVSPSNNKYQKNKKIKAARFTEPVRSFRACRLKIISVS